MQGGGTPPEPYPEHGYKSAPLPLVAKIRIVGIPDSPLTLQQQTESLILDDCGAG